ncbi:hypothetical protein J4772_31425 [Cohnella sp. LGH]|uniref:DUF7010 family protein n=1 Tax=Cohnella sp. LGH TaxID=1619153 RepID=UPI001ADD0B72|nr:hypothetical protein [Cohnella sp. LGH]QTH41973.1 hypothetical protein J4772_31425 [Cohnella sp. LGH]
MNSHSSLQVLLDDISSKQKKGLPFILASICIWGIITIITFSSLDLMVKNIITLSCGALLFPISTIWAKILKVNLFYKENPMINGLLIATNNQVLYLIICVFLLIKAPTLVLPAYAVIYGAHLLPYSFFYQSKGYRIVCIFICLAILVGLVFLRLSVGFIPVIVEIGVISLAILLRKELQKTN